MWIYYAVAPDMSVVPMNATVLVNSNINFTCTANSNPKPHNITWRPHLMHAVNSESHMSSLNSTAVTSTLILRNLEHTYSGSYYCSAYNDIASTEKLAILTVDGKYNGRTIRNIVTVCV